jgi:phosphate transport system substrate-binding protein
VAIISALFMTILTVLPVPPASASEPVNGGGSTWSAVAIEQWQADVAREGLTVNYQATGSTAGRDGYIAGTYDFAVSEIPFQPKYCTTPSDPSTCTDEQTEPGLQSRPFAYMPIVAGGTSLLYNLRINGSQFISLRLTPKTLTQIFTGVITNWDNPAIGAENPNVDFPNQPITPVVRSDGAGTTADITAFMGFEDPADWNAYCTREGIQWSGPVCPPTSQYPASGNMAAEDGSDGVANYVAAPYNNGAIGYAEAAYGESRGVPLASLQNAAGVYTQPTAKAVAVALTRAVIYQSSSPFVNNTENLTGVYANPDPRTYPMSSYSYMIVPITTAAPFDSSKGATLSQFILYFLCQGQQEAAPLGYSPLPPNLVEIGFKVEQQIPGHVALPTSLADCNDPTITGGFLNGIGTPVVAGKGGGATTGSVTPTSSSSGSPSGSGSSATVAVASGKSGSEGSMAAADTAAGGSSHVAAAAGVHGGRSTATSGAAGSGAAGIETGPAADNAASRASALAVSGSPQRFGKAFRPTGTVVAVLVIVATLLIALGPPAVAMARRRRSS